MSFMEATKSKSVHQFQIKDTNTIVIRLFLLLFPLLSVLIGLRLKRQKQNSNGPLSASDRWWQRRESRWQRHWKMIVWERGMNRWVLERFWNKFLVRISNLSWFSDKFNDEFSSLIFIEIVCFNFHDFFF